MADNTTVSTITKDVDWLKSHLILLAAVVVLAAGSVYGVESLVARHDVAREAKDQQILTLITAQTADLKARMTQDEQMSQARDLQYAAIITRLSGTIAKQTGQLQQQIKQNATLTAKETAQAITEKTKAQPGEVTATGDNVTLDLPIARTINSSLDKLTTAQLQLDETNKQLQAQTGLTTDAILDAVDAKRIVTSQQTQLSAADKFCTDKVNVVKAQARKSKLKWFSIGYLLGLASAHFVGI